MKCYIKPEVYCSEVKLDTCIAALSIAGGTNDNSIVDMDAKEEIEFEEFGNLW